MDVLCWNPVLPFRAHVRCSVKDDWNNRRLKGKTLAGTVQLAFFGTRSNIGSTKLRIVVEVINKEHLDKMALILPLLPYRTLLKYERLYSVNL